MALIIDDRIAGGRPAPRPRPVLGRDGLTRRLRGARAGLAPMLLSFVRL